MLNKLHKKIGRQKKGFTLIELIISIFIFTIFLGIVSQSYLSIVRTQRYANEVRKMYSEVRVFMDNFAQEVRLSSVDYNCYEGFQSVTELSAPYCENSDGKIVSGETPILALLKRGGLEKTFFRIEYDPDQERNLLQMKKVYRENERSAWTAVPGYEDFRDVFSEKLNVNFASFAVFPEKNPYSSLNYTNNAVQFQPKVTLFLSLSSAKGTNVDFDYQFQTTVSSRVYSREI